MTDIQKRLDFIDLLRGLVICLMVLDHTRDFVHQGALAADPLDLKSGGPVLYMTRWITHLCAPTFVFLSGLSIFLQKQNGKTGWPLSDTNIRPCAESRSAMPSRNGSRRARAAR